VVATQTGVVGLLGAANVAVKTSLAGVEVANVTVVVVVVAVSVRVLPALRAKSFGHAIVRAHSVALSNGNENLCFAFEVAPACGRVVGKVRVE